MSSPIPFKSLLISASLTAFAIFCALGYSLPDAQTSPIGLQKESRSPASVVQVQGTLTCDMGSVNTGNPCEITLKEADTGRVYRLLQAHKALAFFHWGKKNVTIEGRLSGGEAIEIRTIEEATKN